MIGRTVGSYRVISLLGMGGMGAVYLAEHPLIGKKAAVKVLLPQCSANPMVVQRFFNEARAATLIHHSGLVDVFDYGVLDDGQAFLVMECLEGETLKAARKRQGRFVPAMIVELARQVGSAVGAAHQAGIVHRDLKPDNVFLVPTTELASGVRVKVLDFGIAKLADDISGTDMRTRTDALIGTPTYMSPEQCRGAGEVDHRSDIYSLGCMLYEMACGQPPFAGAGPGDLIAAHLGAPVPDPMVLRPDLPPLLGQVITRTLQKDPAARFQSMAELVRAIEPAAAVVSPSGGAPPPFRSLPDPPRSTLTGATGESMGSLQLPRRRLAPKLAIGGGVAALVLVGFLLLTPRSTPPREPARTTPIVAPLAAPPPAVPPVPQPAARSPDAGAPPLAAAGGDSHDVPAVVLPAVAPKRGAATKPARRRNANEVYDPFRR